MTVRGITLELMVKDVDASIKFYSDILSFDLVASETDAEGKTYWAKMDLDGFCVSFKEENRLKREVPFMQNERIGGSTALCIHVDDLEQYHTRVGKQCELLNHPHPTPCGATQFSMKDNSGYILTFERFTN